MSLTNSNQIDSSIFVDLQKKIDEDSEIREQLKSIVETLSKLGRITQSILARIHNVPASTLPELVLRPAAEALTTQEQVVKKLADVASKYPYYKWNNVWQRDIQNLLSSMQLVSWLGSGRLTTIEEIGGRLQVPINLKDKDSFHITIEDYLLALCSTIEELARLAPNAVTMGDYARPLQISMFIKDVHAGFQLLNLKNDVLRRRSDSIKYSVKRVEDVVYDLSLRGLISRDGQEVSSAKNTEI